MLFHCNQLSFYACLGKVYRSIPRHARKSVIGQAEKSATICKIRRIDNTTINII